MRREHQINVETNGTGKLRQLIDGGVGSSECGKMVGENLALAGKPNVALAMWRREGSGRSTRKCMIDETRIAREEQGQ
jgi:hypothetical protein